MPSIANRKRNANQNHSEVSPHAHENGHRHKNRTLVRTWRSPVRRSWRIHYGKQFGGPPPQINTRITAIQQSHFWVYAPKNSEQDLKERFAQRRSLQCWSQSARRGSSPHVAGGRRMWHTRKATHRAALKKERSCRISDADEPRGRHTDEMSSPGLRREDKPVPLDAQEGSRAVGVTETGRGGGCRGPWAGRGRVRVCGVRRQFRKTEKQTCCTK